MKTGSKKLKKTPKPRKRNRATTDLLEGLAELERYVKRGITIDGMKDEIQHRHSERS